MLQIKYSHHAHNYAVYSMTYKDKGIEFNGYISWPTPNECRIFSSIEGTEFTLVINGVEYFVSNLVLLLKDRWVKENTSELRWGIEYPLSVYPRGNWGADYSACPTDSARKKISVMADLLAGHLKSGTFLAQQLEAYNSSLEYHKGHLMGEIEQLQKKMNALKTEHAMLANEQASFLADNKSEIVFYEDHTFVDILNDITI